MVTANNANQKGSRTVNRNKHDAEPSEQRLQTVSAVAEFLCLSRSKIYAMMDAGELPYVKLGKSRRVRSADVLKLIEENTIVRDEMAH
jgi:excisionase family DNA binding protein